MHDREKARECRHCGGEMLTEQHICAQCGELQRQPRRVRCRHCGTVNSRRMEVCSACGEPLPRGWLRPALITLAILLGVALVLIAALWLPRRPDTIQPPVAVSTEPAKASKAPTLVAAPTGTQTLLPSSTPRPTYAPTSSPTPSLTPTQVDTPTATHTPTFTPSPTPLPTNTPTSRPSPTPTPTNTPAFTPSPTPAPTSTPTSAPTVTSSPTSTVSPTLVTYVVKRGDTLYDIAREYNTTVRAIMETNGLESSRLGVGQELTIPTGTATPTPPQTETPAAALTQS